MTISCLLANAKLTKNITKDFVGGDLSGNLAEVEHALADVLREEVVGDAYLKAFLNTADSFKCAFKRLIMAQVGHDHVILTNRGDGCSFHQQLLKTVGMEMLFCRNKQSAGF